MKMRHLSWTLYQQPVKTRQLRFVRDGCLFGELVSPGVARFSFISGAAFSALPFRRVALFCITTTVVANFEIVQSGNDSVPETSR